MDSVTLRFYHGGLFKKIGVGLKYIGGMGRTFKVDVDELCWFFLEQLAKKCGCYNLIEEIYYLIPGLNLDNGLRKVYTDKEVLEMAAIVNKNRAIDLYVVHGVDKAEVVDPKELQNALNTQQVKVNSSSRGKPSTSQTLQAQTQEHPQSEQSKGQFHISPTKKVSRPNTTPKKPAERVNPPLTRSMTSPQKDCSQKSTTSTHLPDTPLNLSKCYTTEKTTEAQPTPITTECKQANTTSPNTHHCNTDDSYDLYDDRPESPIPWQDLVGDYGSDSDSQDELYTPETEESSEDEEAVIAEADPHGSEFEEQIDEEIERGAEGSEGDTTDEEFQVVKDRVKGLNSRLFEIATDLQKEAAEGRLHSQRKAQSNNGILNACAKVLPRAEHRHCARHIFAHWHKKNKGDEMKILFWKTVWAYNEADFQDSLAEMEKASPSAVDDFKAHNPNVFCRAFLDTTTKCDVVTSNMAETFNGYIIQARTKHLIYMLEDIRCALMQRLVVKRLEMEKSNVKVCPRIQAKLEKHKEEAAECYVMPSSESLFGVSHKLDKLIVNLEDKTCTCRKWNLTGIPCSHAIACIFFMHQEAETYVHPYYLRETYLRAYSTSIPPIEGDRHWPKVDIDLLPPPIKIGPGRPRRNRRKDPYEDPKKKGKLTRHGQVLSCSVCKSKDHTKRKCPDKGKEVQPAPKRPRGRPKKDGSNPTPTSQPQSDVTAEPSRTGRGGRVIRGGRGSRGGGRGGGRGNGGGRGAASGGRTGGGSRTARRIPQGFGVFISTDGTPISNMPGQQGGPRVLTGEALLSSQASNSNTLN
ncbi:Antiviral helicase SKI2 [Bienertia sinuspersici]